MLLKHKKTGKIALLLKESDDCSELSYDLFGDGKIITSTIYYWELIKK